MMVITFKGLIAVLSLLSAKGCLSEFPYPTHAAGPLHWRSPGLTRFAVARDKADETEKVDNPISSVSSSRRFVMNGFALGVLSFCELGSRPDGALAVDFQVPEVSKIPNGPNKQRVGGLANKIRNCCSIMVRLSIFFSEADEIFCSVS